MRPATLQTLPTELIAQIALAVPSLDELLALISSCRTIRQATWEATSFRQQWFARHFPPPPPHSATDFVRLYRERLGIVRRRPRAAAVLEVDDGLVALTLANAVVRAPSFPTQGTPVPWVLTVIWEVVMPWSLRARVVMAEAPIVEEVLPWFDSIVNADGARYVGATVDIQQTSMASNAYLFDVPWAERFCRTAFRGALEQRRRRRRMMMMMMQVDAAAEMEANANAETEARAFLRLQRGIQERIIRSGTLVDGVVVKDTVTFYES
ncbi:hypothetical protein HDU87_008109 [Geranomyces variabilis]|uniref:F-box domain-containing protein n=1 Tax=Geranomyces variabilis TaxID=109894 RepID=A0AAD5TP82_9FUNG|nr:hypothetical protein HDU87_008109 [Geranomyces variabilis]